jgi:hypothetical protein
MEIPNAPRELFEMQLKGVLSGMDTSRLSSAQAAIAAFLKRSSDLKDYIELSRLVARGSKGIFEQVKSIYAHDSEDDVMLPTAQRSMEIIDQIEELIHDLAVLNGLEA